MKKHRSVEDEIKRLKKENAGFKMECEILKKATAYFAKETLGSKSIVSGFQYR